MYPVHHKEKKVPDKCSVRESYSVSDSLGKKAEREINAIHFTELNAYVAIVIISAD